MPPGPQPNRDTSARCRVYSFRKRERARARVLCIVFVGGARPPRCDHRTRRQSISVHASCKRGTRDGRQRERRTAGASVVIACTLGSVLDVCGYRLTVVCRLTVHLGSVSSHSSLTHSLTTHTQFTHVTSCVTFARPFAHNARRGRIWGGLCMHSLDFSGASELRPLFGRRLFIPDHRGAYRYALALAYATRPKKSANCSAVGRGIAPVRNRIFACSPRRHRHGAHACHRDE